MKYIIIERHEWYLLMERVNEILALGGQLAGSFAIKPGAIDWYYQPMLIPDGVELPP